MKIIKHIKSLIVNIFLFVFLIGLPNTFYIQYLHNQYKYSVTVADLIAVKGIQQKPTQLHISRSKAGVPNDLFITLHLKSYTDFSFVNRLPYRCFEFDALSTIDIKDSVTIFVCKEEYEQKLLKTQPLSFWNKHIEYSKIAVYGVETETEICIDKEDYLKRNRPDDLLQHIAVFLLNCFLGILCLIYFYSLFKNFFKK
jgi:hypothetical protein